MALPLPLVLDTTVLSNFSHARRPDVVRHLSRGRALVPPTVMAELQAGVAYHDVPECDWSWLTVVVLTHIEEERALEWALALDPGEREALAVALHRGGTFCSDDMAARRVAAHLGIPLCGTVGLLIRAVKKDILSVQEADKMLRIVRARGYRTPVRSLRDVIRE